MNHAELMRTWAHDDAFKQACSRLEAGADRSAVYPDLVAALEGLVRATESETAHQVAERVGEGLPYLLYEAQDPGDRILLFLSEGFTGVEKRLGDVQAQMAAGFEGVQAQIQAGFQAMQAAPVIVIGSEDLPSPAAVDAARTADPGGVGHLFEALDRRDSSVELTQLMANPPAWMGDLAAQTWALVALMCEKGGLWSVACDAWLRARDRPGADYVDFTMRAAEAKAQTGDRPRAMELLELARQRDADHPRVAFHTALDLADPRETIAALSAIRTEDSELAAMVALAKATTFAHLRELGAARECLEAARAAGAAGKLGYRVAEQSLALLEVTNEQAPSAGRIKALVDEGLSLEIDLRARNLIVQAAQVRAQAASFWAAIDDFSTAVDSLARAVETYANEDADARLTLAMAAATFEANDVIAALLRPEDAEHARGRYLMALLKMNGSDPEKREAAADLDAMLDSRFDEIKRLAAVRRLMVSRRVEGVGWSEQAETIVASHHAETAVAFKSFWLEDHEQYDEAERLLLRHASEPWALAELMRLLMRRGEWTKAAQHARTLLRLEPDWMARLHAAEALRQGGDAPAAQAEYRRIAEDENAPAVLRREAYPVVVQGVLDAKLFPQARRLCEDWLKLEPGSANAGWALIYALMMLGYDREALALLKDKELRPRQPAEYREACQLYLIVGEPEEAFHAILGYANEQATPSEELEAFLITASWRLTELPEELHGRIAVQRFIELFPESTRFRALSFEEFREYLDSGLADQTEHVKSVEREVIEHGQLPSAVLAAVARMDLGHLWLRLSWVQGLPMGYGDIGLDTVELQDAKNAIGGPVLWDPTSIFVADWVLGRPDEEAVAGPPEGSEAGSSPAAGDNEEAGDRRAATGEAELDEAELSSDQPPRSATTDALDGTSVGEVIRTVFPGSSVTQAALTDINQGVRAQTLSDIHGERREVRYNLAAGEPQFVDWDERAICDDELRAARARDFAQGLNFVPNADADAPQPEDQHLAGVDNAAYQCFVATFGTARRLNLPIYSDDRDIRRLARQAGLRAFGTVALIDALTYSEHITPEERARARRTLLSARAMGVTPSINELLLLARNTEYRLTLELAVAILDLGPWRQAGVPTFYRWLTFLRVVHREAPMQFRPWVLRFLDSVSHARPDTPLALHATNLVASTLLSTDSDTPRFVRELFDALQYARQCFAEGLGDDLASNGLFRVAELMRESEYRDKVTVGAAILGRAWLQLPIQDQVRTVHPFLQ
jgi:hypothetical protein